MLSVSGYRGIEIKEYDDENRKRSEEDLIGYRIVKPGQLVVNTMWLNYAGLGVSVHEGYVSPAYRAYWIADGFVKKYVHHLMRSELQVKGYTKFLTGIRPNSLQMSRDDLMAFPVLGPPREEQSAIAAFLDWETAKIDALVAEQEKLIDLLKEKRQAVISHAVTKGLDPNFPMKDSGMEWLGEVPVHWEIVKISRHFSAHKGANAARLTKEYCAEIEGEYPVYSGQTENNGMMACINQYEFDSGAEGVILSTTVGAKSMSVSQISGKFSLSQNCMIIIPRQQDLSIRFFYYHFQPLFQYERDLIPNHMQPSFRMEDLYSYQIVLPPQEEQSAIAALLDREVAKIDDLVTESQHAIDLLKERRAALISAAVTGKIDVRHLHPQEMEDA